MVKQGYSVKEIKEVFELGKEIETEETQKEETDPAGGIQEQDPGPDPEQDPPAEDPQPDLKYQELALHIYLPVLPRLAKEIQLLLNPQHLFLFSVLLRTPLFPAAHFHYGAGI